jgi:hypothetical protein
MCCDCDGLGPRLDTQIVEHRGHLGLHAGLPDDEHLGDHSRRWPDPHNQAQHLLLSLAQGSGLTPLSAPLVPDLPASR